MTCSSVAAATEVYQTYCNMPSRGFDPLLRPTMPTTTGYTPSDTDTSNTLAEPTASGSGSDEATGRHERPMQPFCLDESISDLAGHECYWVTWAAVRPGVYFGM